MMMMMMMVMMIRYFWSERVALYYLCIAFQNIEAGINVSVSSAYATDSNVLYKEEVYRWLLL